jgi:hypothetical protein
MVPVKACLAYCQETRSHNHICSGNTPNFGERDVAVLTRRTIAHADTGRQYNSALRRSDNDRDEDWAGFRSPILVT